MGSEWVDRRTGEMCVLHRTVLKSDSENGRGFVVVSCDDRCPEYRRSSPR